MANLTSKFIAAVAEPTGVWEKIIMAFHGGIHNYAWAVIVFTLVLKLVLLPLDFLNKWITQKNTRIQAVIQPELAKLQKQYGANKQVLNQKTMELYKKNNYNVTGSCIIMLVNLALTMFIFITLFSGLNSMAAYKNAKQYNEIQKSYYSAADYGIDDIKNKYKSYFEEYVSKPENLDADGKYNEALAHAYAKEETKKLLNNTNAVESEVATKNANALEKYKQVKESWLWIDNIWKSDTPWTSSVASFDEYVAGAKIKFSEEKITVNEKEIAIKGEDLKDLAKVEYETIMNPIRDSAGRANGYLIIVILATGANLLSMLIMQGKIKFKRKKKNDLQPEEEKQKQPGGLLMMILIPALMLYITLTYNAVFGLYILMGSVFGIATTPLINWLIKVCEKRAQNKKPKESVSYSRKK